MSKKIAAEATVGIEFEYDPEDPLTLLDAHGVIPGEIQGGINRGVAAPIYITSGSVYPNGRVKSVLIKGIDPDQKVLDIPSATLKGHQDDIIPALIGRRMAKSCGLEVGSEIMMRWRDSKGVFDARLVTIVHIMNTVVMTIDKDQLWLPLDKLQELKLIVSFNGTSFDVPVVMQNFRIHEFPVPHLDLRWICYHEGIRGGLKEIEKILNIKRPADLSGVDGMEAVLLWERWVRLNEQSSLEKLIKYCSADVLSLVKLSEKILSKKLKNFTAIDDGKIWELLDKNRSE